MEPRDNSNDALTRLSVAQVIFKPAHLRRTGLTALLVGSWLTAINQWDVIAATGFDLHLALKVFMNYLTPLVVANIGLLSRRSH